MAMRRFWTRGKKARKKGRQAGRKSRKRERE